MPGSGGLYCEQNWVDALNDALATTNIDLCGNQDAISMFLAHVAA